MGRTSHQKELRITLAENARRARLTGDAGGLGAERELGENERPRANWSQISPHWIRWFHSLSENEKQPILERLSKVDATEIDDAIRGVGRTAREVTDFACLVMKRRLSTEISTELPIGRYDELLYLFQMLKEAPGLLLKVVSLFAKQENNSKTIVERFIMQNNIHSADDMTPANKAALLDQLRGALSDAGLDALIVENSSSIRDDIRRELLKSTANRFRDFVKVRRARKTNPTDRRTTKDRVHNAVDILNEISQGNIAQVLADVIEHLDLKDEIAEKLNMYTKKFNAEDMIAFMCLNHKISFSVLDLMWRAAPDVFPSPTEIDNRLKQNLGKLNIGREVLEDGTMEARMFMYREVLTQRLQALLARHKVSSDPEERIIITWVLWLDGYSSEKHHHDPAMKTGLHRWVAAGKIVQMDKLDSSGKFHEIYRPDKVDSRRDAVPIIICRGKEDSATVRRYLESWSDVIDEGEQGMFLDADRTQKVYIESWLACDQPMHSIIVGGSSSACSTPSLMRSTDETFSRVLPRLSGGVDKLRTVEMRQLKGTLADLIHKDKFSISEITKAIAEAENSISERFQNLEELAVLKRFRDAVAMQFADADESLLRFDPDKIGRGDDARNTVRSSGDDSQGTSTGSSQIAYDQISQQLELVNEDGDRDLNEHGEEEEVETDELNHLSLTNLTGPLKIEAYDYANWFINELAGQKTRPILPVPPQRAPIPLLHLEESVARFLRNAAATIAHDGGKLDDLIGFWKSNHMVALAGTMQGNDCRSLVDRCGEWLVKIQDCPNSEDLKVLIYIWRTLRGLLRSSSPTDEQRDETLTMIQRFGVESNTRFPTTPWTNYIMELIWNVPVFVHDRVPLARKSEDGFEGMIWELKHLPTSGGGGTKTLGEEHREEPEYQILARLWSTHDPSNITERAKEVATKPMRSQACTCCAKGGHNIRTCQKKQSEKDPYKLPEFVVPDLTAGHSWIDSDLSLSGDWRKMLEDENNRWFRMAAGNTPQDKFQKATLADTRLRWQKGAGGRKVRYQIVERAYLPAWSSWIVAKSRAALKLTLGSSGMVSLTWNCVGLTTEYKFNTCSKVHYECVPSKGIVVLTWEEIPKMDIERNGINLPGHIALNLPVYNVPKLVVWLPLDCIGDWWSQYADKGNLPSTLAFKKSAGAPVPHPKRFRHPKALKPKPKQRKSGKEPKKRRGKTQESQSMDL